jgi:hypothetical protein
MYQALAHLLAGGAISVTYRGSTLVLADVRLIPQILNMSPGMRMFISPEGLMPLTPAELMNGLPPYYYEVLPAHLYRLCR